MLDDDSPGLGVDFVIDAGDSYAELTRLASVMASTEAKVLADAKRIEQATKGMVDLTAATVSIKTFGTATTRVEETIRRDKAKTEQSIEGFIKALDRETAAVGRSRAEQRAARMEEAAAAAAAQGNTDAVARLRASQAALYDAQFKLMRRQKAEAEALAEAEAQSDSARDRQAAIVSSDAYAAKLEAETVAIGRNAAELRAMEVAQRSAAAAAAGMPEQAERIRQAGAAYAEAHARVSALAAEERRLAEAAREAAEAARQAAAAQAAQDASVASLRSSIDPLYGAQQRLSRELEDAVRLYRAGAIGQDEYERSSRTLAARLDDVQRAQARASQGITDSADQAGLGASDLTNIFFQLQDVIVSLAGGQNPFMVLIQQGSQLGGIMAQTGATIGGMARAIAGLFVVSTPTAAALAALTAAQTALTAAHTASATAGTRAAIAAAELTVAEEIATRAGIGDAAAQAALAVARRNAAAAAGVATAASTQLATAQAASASATSAAAASATRSLAPWLATLARFGGPLIAAAGAVALFDRSVSKGIDTKAMVDGLGLTRAEIKRLENTSVTSGDVIKGTFQVLAQRVGLDLSSLKTVFGEAMDAITRIGADAMAGLYAGVVGTFDGIAIAARRLKEGNFTGFFGEWDKAMGARFNEARGALNRFGADVTKQIAANKKADLERQAAELKLERTPKTDRHAEQLAREAEATEAQIRNLYKLAAAYGVSGAAALIAEARVKAETAAIKKQAEIEEFVARQVRLAIAQRVADAAKGTAALRDQIAVQRDANAAMLAGQLPAEQAAGFIRDRMADLPLLAAMEAAKTVKDVAGMKEAAAALAEQRDAQDALTDAERESQRVTAMGAGAEQLAILREELRLVGATEMARVKALATLRAEQAALANGWGGPKATAYVKQQVEIADATRRLADEQASYNEQLTFTADRWDAIAGKVQSAASGMADAFGIAGRAIGDLASIYASYNADRERAEIEHAARIDKAGDDKKSIDRENMLFAIRSSGAQITAFGDMAAAAKGFFKEGSSGYKALAEAEKVFRAVQFALSVRAMAQDLAETASKLASGAARIAIGATEAVVNAIKSLPFPLNIAAGAATVAALASIGVAIGGAFGGGKASIAPTNTGTGSVLGDSTAKSESVKRSIDALREVDTLTNSYSRQMLESLRSIDAQIGSFAAQIAQAGNVNASADVATGFKTDTTGKVLSSLVDPTGLLSKIPVIGGIFSGIKSLIGSLFGTKTSVIGSGLYGGAQSLGRITADGFDASYYSDVEKKKRFLGITTGTSYSTQYSAADTALANQFTLILRSFDDAITAAAGPLGIATGEIENRLNGFVVNIGKIDLQGLTGEEIQTKLTNVFGAVADNLAAAALPGFERYQKVGEGLFETVVRVASTVEQVTNSLDTLGAVTRALGIDAKLGLADQFDSVGALTSAVDAYFAAFYTKQEQATARAAQFGKVFDSLGLSMPSTLASFRQLVEAQDLTTAAGQSSYATLLQLAPAFADLQSAMAGAKSAADILSERQDLERKLLELRGDTATIRALDLAKLDASNRALQEQIYAVQDAQQAAAAAKQLQDAWTSVGDSIMDEVKRIRGLTGVDGTGSFASLMGQFNAATSAARGGDQDSAKLLPGLSQSLLKAAADVATSRQELDRVQAQAAASLEATYGIVMALTGAGTTGTTSTLNTAATTAQAGTTQAANDDVADEVRGLREENAGMRRDLTLALATIAGNTGRIDKKLDAVTADSGGTAVSVASAA